MWSSLKFKDCPISIITLFENSFDSKEKKWKFNLKPANKYRIYSTVEIYLIKKNREPTVCIIYENSHRKTT